MYCPSVKTRSSESCVDDSKLLLSFRIEDSDTAKADINSDLLKIRNRYLDNYLLLNLNKTKWVFFKTRDMIRNYAILNYPC